jgi:hypothetical protein
VAIERKMPAPNKEELGEDFLDPIPEDTSVYAKSPQRIRNLSSAPVVASSNSVSIKSDTGVLFGGDEEQPPSQNQQQRQRRESTTLFKACNRRLLQFSLFVVVLLIGIGIGIYFIVTAVTSNHDTSNTLATLSPVPTTSPSYPSFDDYIPINGGGIEPSSAPTYTSLQIQIIDEILLQISRSSSSSMEDADLYNTDTPHGSCRFWITQTDEIDLELSTTSTTSEERIQQRYILCLLYMQLNGGGWNLDVDATFVNAVMHECLWDGITCDNDNFVAVIDLAENNLIGSLPNELEKLQKLELLRLSGNAITGTIPNKLCDLPLLVWLDLSSNQLTGSIAASSSPSSPLGILYLQSNQLQGSVPYFHKLEKLWIHENRLSILDESYATSSSLRSFIAYDNKFKGLFPQTWNVPKLQALDLGLNEWEGSIPMSLWQNAPKLELLLLNENQLEGTLPASTASVYLQTVWLHSNQLTGTIPESFGQNWGNLTSLLLQDNLLRGNITQKQCLQWEDFEKIEADCNLPSLTCACCTDCYGKK